mgnify:CR=1 FL=1
MTLLDGKTVGVPYPKEGYNCNADWALVQKKSKDNTLANDYAGLEHCPDFDERFTLTDGKTRGIPYPQPGYNCTAEWALSKNSNQVHNEAQHLVQDSEKLTI